MKENLYQEHFEVQSHHWWFKGKKSIILATIKKYAIRINKLNVLDVGCGTGLMLQELKAFGVVSGMDFSEEAIQFCRKNFSGNLQRGDLPESVPFENASFDLLVGLDVLEHIDDDVAAMKKMNELVSLDGLCVLTVPAFMFLWTDHDVANQHRRRYTKEEFKVKLLKANFEIVKLSYYNSFLFPLALIFRVLNRLFNIKSGADLKVPRPLINSIFYKIFSFERFVLDRFGFPFGVSLLAVVRKKLN